MAAMMLQGTGSDVGKTVLVAGLCRAYANRGLRVRPFKPQNMSNNAAVTADGGEIGRAQALQAIAARVAPTTDMNPVLLKPQTDRTAQLVVNGKVAGTLGTENFREGRKPLLPVVLESFRRLQTQCDLVIVEGAGSAAETNLRAGDIANMGFARAANVPVVIVGDIDRGGVIASLVGTRVVLDANDAAMVRGFIVNKFRGDVALFMDGYREIEARTGWRGFGIVPWLRSARHLPSEDAVVLQTPRVTASRRVTIACPILPHISNFDDLDPWALEDNVALVMVPPGRPLPADVDLVVLAGSKSTIADLVAMRREGWDIDILAHHRRGGRVLGLCGGYQMLGRSVGDPDGIEGDAGQARGLGLLDVVTRLSGEKTLTRVSGIARDAPFDGYEMHVGVTERTVGVRPFAHFDDGRADGAISADGRVVGTYVHGLFARAEQRAAWLSLFDHKASGQDYDGSVDAALNDIAAELETHLDLDALLGLARAETRPVIARSAR